MIEANKEPGVIDYFTAALFFSPQGHGQTALKLPSEPGGPELHVIDMEGGSRPGFGPQLLLSPRHTGDDMGAALGPERE